MIAARSSLMIDRLRAVVAAQMKRGHGRGSLLRPAGVARLNDFIRPIERELVMALSNLPLDAPPLIDGDRIVLGILPHVDFEDTHHIADARVVVTWNMATRRWSSDVGSDVSHRGFIGLLGHVLRLRCWNGSGGQFTAEASFAEIVGAAVIVLLGESEGGRDA